MVNIMDRERELLKEKIDHYNQLIRDIGFVKLIIFSFTLFIVFTLTMFLSFILYGVFF